MTGSSEGRRGVLAIVGTPIGNLGDISSRSVETLGAAALVACEDTRRTGRLLQHLAISAPAMCVVNQYTEMSAVGRVLDVLASGGDVALVSDAGMPVVSDPGASLVDAVARAGYEVVVVPGPSAVVAALAVSGLVGDRFCFEGFLPRKGADRRARIADLSREPRISVLFEAPHRIVRTMDDLAHALGPTRTVTICRELTKRYEEVWRGSLSEAVVHVHASEPRGEYVIVLAGVPIHDVAPDDDEVIDAIRVELVAGESRRDAIDTVAASFGVSRRRVYRLAVGAAFDATDAGP
jgi:16S rRNA (cytidine1402-2'-O)-methyltransferase